MIDIVKGETNYAMLSVKQIFKEAIVMQAQKIIMVHNHPSGDVLPSEKDIIITKKVLEAADTLGIQLVDHVIIAKDRYFSIIADLSKKH